MATNDSWAERWGMGAEFARRILLILFFALAFALCEAALVVVARALLGIAPGAGYYGEFDDWIAMVRTRYPWLLPMEQARELATLAVMAALAWLAGRDAADRLGILLITFGLWDLFYYGWLRALIGFPKSLAQDDLLFLVPVHPWWVQPVWLPVAASVVMCIAGAWLMGRSARRERQ